MRVGNALPIVGMKQNDFRLNTELAKFGDLFFQMLEKSGIESGEVPVCCGCSFKRIEARLGAVIDKPFRKYTHAQFVEWRSGESFQRAFLQFRRLMNPRVTSRADLPIRTTIGVSEMVGVTHSHRAVIASGASGNGQRAGLAIEFRTIAVRAIFPFADGFGHEANSIDSIAIVESRDGHTLLILLKGGGKLYVHERVAVHRPFERSFEHSPLLDGIWRRGQPGNARKDQQRKRREAEKVKA